MGSRLEKNSAAVRKRIDEHTFSGEDGDEYEASKFGGFGDYFRRKKIKLQNVDAELRASAEGKPQIFKGVVAHVTGYTQPPLHILHRELVHHGAGYLQYLDGKTMATHIIASAMPPKKAVDYSRYRVVKPAWVTDSIAAGRMLPWSEYRVIDEGPRQKTIKFDDGKLATQSSSPRRGYREQTENSFYTSQLKSPDSPAGRIRTSGSGFHDATPSKLRPLESIEDEEDSLPTDMEMGQAEASLVAERLREPDDLPPDNDDMAVATLEFSETALIEPLKPPDDEFNGKVEGPPKLNMTSEEHNAWLLSDPHIRKASSANPEFLKQFYSESRLHHLSTWKAELKSKMQKLANEKGPAAKTIKRKPGTRRYIMHVDFDSFFCAVSLKQAPDYIDKPAVVAHGHGSGSEIASCNYPARKFGVKNGMWMKRAQELCPDLKILPYDFPAYEEASRLFYEAILELGGVVQSVSIDEALVDVTSLVLSAASSKGHGVSEGSIWREQEKVDEMASNLRQRIREKTGCNVSVGVGGNILLAKVALRRAKPAGQYQIKPEEVLEMLGELKVDDLPGVAYSISGKLEEIGVKFVKDIREVSKERLMSVLGPKTGEKLWEYSRGIDRTEVGEQAMRKSVSAEVNWGIRFISQQEAEEFIINLCKELERRLLNEQVKGKNLTMKIMRRALDAPLDPAKHLGHGRCDTFNKSVTFGVATHDAEAIGKEAVSILRSYKFSPGDLRGLGVQLTKLEPIKSSAAPEGSQKKLSFGTFASAPSAKKEKADPIEEDIGSPGRKKPVLERGVSEDPISEDPLTPRKPKPTVHPALALARANAADEKARTPLNMTGTQFVIPTNPDLGVLAELPQDIRSRLMAQQQRAASTSREASPAVLHINSRGQSPMLTGDIPPDIDPEVFNALPDDMKAEVLATYRPRRGSSAIPQSPRADRTNHRPTKKPTPTKKGIRGMWNRAKERQQDADARLLQTSFVSAGENGADDVGSGADDVEELDAEFLAELPEEVRREVIADHRRRKLAKTAGLNFQAPQKRLGDKDASLPGGQTKISFPAPPPKVVFTNSSLTSLQEVKDMLNAWHRETKDEGPHRADVGVFEKYLRRVVVEEKDMEKARKLVTWLEWIVEEEEVQSKGKTSWQSAVRGIKDEVQGAVRSRGFGPLSFD
ncbi:DNA repair protein REV1 [Pleurostoma richardsiae]|uniref:DNA repair protein REV1 n=1 Tax=Pleurostoma richardsiae TaxID=41990 RepID=A0AA38SEY1_9PEZI|nr:DNA repair protein REV1 [Pleurostoma richardsiae]